MRKFFAVAINKAFHTTDSSVSILDCTNAGYTVREASGAGDYDVETCDGKKIAILFSSRIEASVYLNR